VLTACLVARDRPCGVKETKAKRDCLLSRSPRWHDPRSPPLHSSACQGLSCLAGVARRLTVARRSPAGTCIQKHLMPRFKRVPNNLHINILVTPYIVDVEFLIKSSASAETECLFRELDPNVTNHHQENRKQDSCL
jgi:hypothetical protein